MMNENQNVQFSKGFYPEGEKSFCNDLPKNTHNREVNNSSQRLFFESNNSDIVKNQPFLDQIIC